MTEEGLVRLLDGVRPRLGRGVSLWRDGKDVTKEVSPDRLYVAPHLETSENVTWVEKGGVSAFYRESYDDVREEDVRGWYAP